MRYALSEELSRQLVSINLKNLSYQQLVQECQTQDNQLRAASLNVCKTSPLFQPSVKPAKTLSPAINLLALFKPTTPDANAMNLTHSKLTPQEKKTLLHPGALLLLWFRGPYYFYLSFQANQSSCQNHLRSSSHPAYFRTYSKLGKKVVPGQSCSQGPAESVSNLGYLAYHSECLDNKCIFISYILGNFKCNALLNSGYSAYACIGNTFAQVFHQEPLPKLRTLRSYDGKILATTHLVKIRISLVNDAHQEDISMFVTPGLHYDVILGMPYVVPLRRWQRQVQ